MRKALSLISLGAAFAVHSEDVIERKPLAVTTKIETGKIVEGENSESMGGEDPDNFFLSNMGVSLTQEMIVNERLNLKVGVSGLSFYSFPNRRGNPSAQGSKFGAAIPVARGLLKFGDMESPWGTLNLGYFPYKYNPDSKNLGEYLFRSMPYPAAPTTGGWSIVDNAFSRVLGTMFSVTHSEGKFKHDLILASERDFRPQGDFSPAYNFEGNLGAFQFGAGISFHHLIPIDGKLTKTDPANAAGDLVVTYRTFPGFTVTTNPRTTQTETPVVHTAGQKLTVSLTDLDGIVAENPALILNADKSITDAAGNVYKPDTVLYTTQGIKAMARASFDIQKILPMEFLNPNDLRIYGEVALLGWENQAGYYEKRADRITRMFGFNLPTFRLVDAMTVEVEYFPNPMPDDFEQVISKGNYNPIPEGSGLLFPTVDHKDDWKWSVYASKQVMTGFSVKGQIANDHFRAAQTPPNVHLLSSTPLTRELSHWYFIVALQFGI